MFDTWSGLQRILPEKSRSGMPRLRFHGGKLWTVLRRVIGPNDYPHDLLNSQNLGEDWDICTQMSPNTANGAYGDVATLGDDILIVQADESDDRGTASVKFRRQTAP